MTQLLTDLLAVRELLSAPERWTQGCAARDRLSCPVAWDSGEATCWCLLGAVARAVPVVLRQHAINQAICSVLGASENMSGFNDAPERAHAEVLAVIDKAIAAERRAA